MNKQSNNRAECWLVAVPVGLFAGWMTAATLVELFGTFVIFQLLAGSLSETVLGVTFLLLGALLTAPAIMIGKGGPPQGYVAYAGTVLWALIGNHREPIYELIGDYKWSNSLNRRGSSCSPADTRRWMALWKGEASYLFRLLALGDTCG